jgi:uncharacterized protein (DUF1330 family)
MVVQEPTRSLNARQRSRTLTAYCLWDVRTIHDRAAMDEYVERVPATVEAYGGEYVVIGGPWQVVEGDWHPTYPVVIVFPSIEAADAWYDSDEYSELKQLRLRATECDAVFMQSSRVAAHAAETGAEVAAR